MAGVNKAIILGRVGKDPELRYTPTGDAVCSTSIATSEQWKDKTTGEKQEKTEWHNVVLFRKIAEIFGTYVRKGDQIYIEGKIQTKKWQDKNGQDRYTTQIVANEIKLLGSKQHDIDRESQQSGTGNGNEAASSTSIEDDDLPF